MSQSVSSLSIQFRSTSSILSYLSVLFQPGGLLLHLLHPGGSSAPPMWSSAPLWRSYAPSALHWWAPALPWGSADLFALLWWSSAPPVPGPASVPSSYTSTWTWLSIPPPDPPLHHHPPRLYCFGSIWKPLLGGALSWILSVTFHPFATRCRLLIILTLTPHRLLHITLDYISHVPFALITHSCNQSHAHLKAITHTLLHPLRSCSSRRVLFSDYHSPSDGIQKTRKGSIM